MIRQEEEKQTWKHRGDSHGEMEAGIGMIWPQAKEHLEPPEAGSGGQGFSVRALRVWVRLHLGFRLPASITVREYISVVLSHQICGDIL